MHGDPDFWYMGTAIILVMIAYTLVYVHLIYWGILGSLMLVNPPLVPIAKKNKWRLITIITVLWFFFGGKNKTQVYQDGVVSELTKIRQSMEGR